MSSDLWCVLIGCCLHTLLIIFMHRLFRGHHLAHDVLTLLGLGGRRFRLHWHIWDEKATARLISSWLWWHFRTFLCWTLDIQNCVVHHLRAVPRDLLSIQVDLELPRAGCHWASGIHVVKVFLASKVV